MSPGSKTFRALVSFLAAAVLAGALSGCSKEEQPVSGPVVKKMAPAGAAPVSPPSPAAKTQVDNTQAPAQGSAYDPSGKRDPFVPFVKADREAMKDDRSALPPLQRYDLGELRFVGVVWVEKGAKALVQDAEGKGYSVVIGTRIGRAGGVVTRITDREITVKEEFPGTAGRTVTRESVLQLTTAGGTQ
ncbi:MAG: pilus assembly protein PilP [Thermodesulfobacteriota bacterium]